MEPTAVLVGTFQIDIGGPQLGGVLHQRCKVGGAGVKPAIEGVGFLVEGSAAAVRTGKAFGNQFHGFGLKPDIGAVLIKQLGDLFDGIRIGNGLAAILAVEYGNGQTPTALTADTPVCALTDHADHALAAPAGEPLNIFNGFNGLILEGFH